MGKLIVFEGTDGTGKSTQFALLTKRLQSENIPFRPVAGVPPVKRSCGGSIRT